MVSDVLILGGGLAGGAAATLLARQGVRVRVIEREAGPHHKVCGEFLSMEAQHELDLMGIDVERLGAMPVDRLRVIRGQRIVETRLPFMACGIGRDVLDEALLHAAKVAGAVVERGVRVIELRRGEARTSAGDVRADTILLATGKHNIRGASRNPSRWRDDYVGLKMHWRLGASGRREPDGAIEMVLFDGGYAGLQRVTPDTLNLCVLIQARRLEEIGGDWDSLLTALMSEPHLARRLGDAQPLFPRPLAVAGLPYGYVYGHDHSDSADAFRLGDQAALTAPLTGDGMAAALRSARLAALCVTEGVSPHVYHDRLRPMISRQIRRAMHLQRATEAPRSLTAGLALMRIWPGLLGRMAAATRLPAWNPL